MWFDLFLKSYSVAYIHSHIQYSTTVSYRYDTLHWLLIVFAIYSDLLTKHSEWKTI